MNDKLVEKVESGQNGRAQKGYFVAVEPLEDENSIDLHKLLVVLLRYKYLIVTIVLVCFFVSVTIAMVITPLYRADVLLAPAGSDNSNSGGLAAIASQFGGLANLAGISVGEGSDIETVLATLRSRKFLGRFVSDFDLKPILFSDQWDSEKKEWVVEESFIFGTAVKEIEGLDPGEPSPGRVYRKLKDELLKVSRDNKTQLITVSIEWEDPHLAAKWANALITRLNEELRQKRVAEAERSISYLKEQVNQTSLSELQNVLYRLIEEHTKVITLAKVNEEYVLKIIDPAVQPEKHSKPNRVLIVVLGFAAGILLALSTVFIHVFISNIKKQNASLYDCS